MAKSIIWLALASIVLLASCQPNNKPNTGNSSEKDGKSQQPGIVSKPDPNDLLRTLQGKWQMEGNPDATLEITDTNMRYYNGTQVSKESMLDIDGNCESAVCHNDGIDTSDGWCFTESSIGEGGKFVAGCQFVVQCDTARLQFHPLGDEAHTLSYKKIQ